MEKRGGLLILADSVFVILQMLISVQLRTDCNFFFGITKQLKSYYITTRSPLYFVLLSSRSTTCRLLFFYIIKHHAPPPDVGNPFCFNLRVYVICPVGPSLYVINYCS